jgi:hypothetical protein
LKFLHYPLPTQTLFAQSESFNQFVVSADVLPIKVVQQSSSLSNQLEQTALGMKVVFVLRHMIGQLLYPIGKQSYLHLGRTGVAFLAPVFADYLSLLLLVQTTPHQLSVIDYKSSDYTTPRCYM